MGRSADVKDPRVETPKVYDSGLSDLVPVFTSDGRALFAQYTKEGWWIGEGGETFGGIISWVDHFPWPRDWEPDYDEYGGEP